MPIDVGTSPPCLMAVSFSNMSRRVLSCRAMLTTCYAQIVESCQGEGGTGLETTTRSYMQHQPQKCNKQLLQTKKTHTEQLLQLLRRSLFFQKPDKTSGM